LSVYSLTGYNVAIMQCALGLGAALNQEDIELGNNQWMKFNAEKNSKTAKLKIVCMDLFVVEVDAIFRLKK